VLAQRAFAPPAPTSGVPADGPLLGPPVIDLPGVPSTPVPPSGATSGEKRKLFRLPSSKTDSQTAPSANKLLPSRWKQRQPAGPTTDAKAFAPGAAISPQPAAPNTDPAPKRLFTPRKYGPVEAFPKAKASAQTGNPLSIRRPMLAW